MSKISINDWQIIQTRKELQTIRRRLKDEKAANTVIITELMLVVVGFCLNNTTAGQVSINLPWIIIAGIAIILAILLPAIRWCRNRMKKNRLKLIKDPHEVISLFDDELCYYVMTALSFLEAQPSTISGLDTPSHTQKHEVEMFYYIEASYYLNKCVMILNLMRNNWGNLVEKNEDTQFHDSSKISFYRFKNTITLLAQSYIQINHVCNQHTPPNERMLKENHSYMTQLDEIINAVNRQLDGDLLTIKQTRQSMNL